MVPVYVRQYRAIQGNTRQYAPRGKWEPAANLENNTVLKEYLAAQKAQKAQK